MRTIEKYVADDGKEFDSFHDCELYEATLRGNKVGNRLRLYTADGHRVGLNENRLVEVYYVIWEGKEAFEVLKDIWTEECGFYDFQDNFFHDPETNGGKFVYLNIDDEERWWPMEDVEHLTDMLEKTLNFMEQA